MAQRISHVIGFDDAPFSPQQRGNVLLVGVVYAGPRLEGVLSGRVRRDGVNSTRTIVRLVSGCRFYGHLQAVLLQGITFAGFNVVDLQAAYQALGMPVIAVTHRQPNMKRQKDEDARWIKKHGKSHYGYKNHINVDKERKLIRGSRVQMLRSGDPVGVKGL